MEYKSIVSGDFGENLAAAQLQTHGFEVISFNYRTRFGEIDVLAKDSQYMVFSEVKTRSVGAKISGAEAVDLRKQARLRSAAEQYLTENPTDLQPRFDVFCLEIANNGSLFSLNWYENAF